MIRKTLAVAIVAVTLLFSGCEGGNGLTPASRPSGQEVARKAQIGTEWQMAQLKMDVAAGSEISVLLRLSNGGKVDGFFYLEKGDGVDFEITGTSLIYRSQAPGGKVTSDRFSFTTGPAQGTSYTLTFRKSAEDSRSTAEVFFEIIYPIEGTLFVPLEGEQR